MYQNQVIPNPYFDRSIPQAPQPTGGIVWVQGIEGAKGWQMLPNTNIILLDSENEGVMYIKTCDNIGICTMRIFDFTERTSAPNSQVGNLSEYVRKDELQDLIQSIMGGNNNEPSVSTTKPRSNKNGGSKQHNANQKYDEHGEKFRQSQRNDCDYD